MATIFEKLRAQLLTDKFWLSLAKVFFLIGAALIALYVIALSQNPVAHEAFHDIRHAAGFPCH